MPTVTWDAAFEAAPADTDEWKYGANKIRQLKEAISERGDLEHNWDTGTQPFHKAGKCSVLYSGNTTDIANLTGMSAGSVAWDTTLSVMKRYTGNAWAAMSIDHGQLAGLADDDHTQYQLESEKSAANGYAGLNADSKVVQNPANANLTATANGIPLANANGVIDSDWLSLSANLSANGYSYHACGLILQWGTAVLPASGTGNISFPIAFPTGCLNIQVTKQYTRSSDDTPPFVHSANTVGFRCWNYNNCNYTIYWFVIGH